MPVHLHPVSKAPIEGTILPFGTELLEGDVYDSTKGNWEPNPIPGVFLGASCTIWVRPSGDSKTISEEGKRLLCDLEEHNFLLTEDSWHWKAIPSPHWKDDARMDWGVKHPECIPELISRGFLLPYVHGAGCYEVTDAGKEAAKVFRQN
jgi:hypothetical protein